MDRFGAFIGLIPWRSDGGLSSPRSGGGSRFRSRPGDQRRPRRPDLGLERLESRVALSAIIVNTFVDETNPNDGTTSLREAITQAASSPGADTMELGNNYLNHHGPGLMV